MSYLQHTYLGPSLVLLGPSLERYFLCTVPNSACSYDSILDGTFLCKLPASAKVLIKSSEVRSISEIPGGLVVTCPRITSVSLLYRYDVVTPMCTAYSCYRTTYLATSIYLHSYELDVHLSQQHCEYQISASPFKTKSHNKSTASIP